jgi:hypothetical protein
MSYYNNNYATLGQITKKSTWKNDPNEALTMCLTDTMDKYFVYGGEINHFAGTKSVNCHEYMAQRCADNWDGYCEYFYRENGPTGQWPNNKLYLNPINRPWEEKVGIAQQKTMGEHLLRNTAEVKYCKFERCRSNCCPATTQPFNPISANTPAIQSNPSNCIPVCTVDPKTINSDPVMNRILENPTVAAGTIINICNNSKNRGIDLSNTKIGKLCDAYFQNLSK